MKLLLVIITTALSTTAICQSKMIALNNELAKAKLIEHTLTKAGKGYKATSLYNKKSTTFNENGFKLEEKQNLLEVYDSKPADGRTMYYCIVVFKDSRNKEIIGIRKHYFGRTNTEPTKETTVQNDSLIFVEKVGTKWVQLNLVDLTAGIDDLFADTKCHPKDNPYSAVEIAFSSYYEPKLISGKGFDMHIVMYGMSPGDEGGKLEPQAQAYMDCATEMGYKGIYVRYTWNASTRTFTASPRITQIKD